MFWQFIPMYCNSDVQHVSECIQLKYLIKCKSKHERLWIMIIPTELINHGKRRNHLFTVSWVQTAGWVPGGVGQGGARLERFLEYMPTTSATKVLSVVGTSRLFISSFWTDHLSTTANVKSNVFYVVFLEPGLD